MVAKIASNSTKPVAGCEMANTAIVVGNSDYRNLAKLECCHHDILAIKQLLEATGKYDKITAIENAEADALKSEIRAAVDQAQSPDELFFYFTGHGLQHETEFFFCATNFDSKRPNETGISTTELHTLLRLADAGLVVKVVDACNSGTLLIKSEGVWTSHDKNGFKNIIQIASCLDSQNSLTGNPLSLFTDTFVSAALRKTEGIVFYTDIINSLRDYFISNDSQTPFFVSQSTGREQFVDDATKLNGLRKSLEKLEATADQSAADPESAPRALTLLDRLRAADERVVTSKLMTQLVEGFFDSLIERISTGEFSDFFDLDIKEHSQFIENTAMKFIISTMRGEKRPDNFVTANYSRVLRKENPLLSSISFFRQYIDDAFQEKWYLYLNCAMKRAQLRITFKPKFANLQQVVLVVSCAPSLDHCYVFEIATEHLRHDFERFDDEGHEVSRRWWKLGWRDSTEGVVQQISSKLIDAVRSRLESAEKRLSGNS